MVQKRWRAMVVVAGAAMGAGGAATHAQQTRTWANNLGGNWGVNSNWNPATGFPNNAGPNTFNAVIDLVGPSYTVTLDQPITIQSLTLTAPNATLDLTNFDLVLNANFTLSNSTIGGFGGAGTVRTSGAITFNDATLLAVQGFISQGSILFDSVTQDEICDTGINHAGVSVVWAGTGNILMDRGASFLNGAASTFTINSDRNLFWNNVGAQPTFTNTGTIRKTASAGVSFVDGVSLDNAGTIQVDSGTFRANLPVQVAGSTLTGGKWVVTAGSNLDLVGAAVTTNAGDVTLQDAGSQFGAINGLTTNAAPGRLSLQTGRNFLTQGGFTNDGTLAVGSGTFFQVQSPSPLTNYNGVTRTLTGGTYDLAGQLRFDNVDIQTLNADVRLSGAGSDIVNPVGGQSGVRNLATIGPTGKFSIANGRNFQSTGNLSVAPTGALTVGTGSLFRVAPGSSLSNIAGGVFTGGVFNLGGVLQVDQAAITTVANALVLDGPGNHLINQAGQSAFLALNSIPTGGDLSIASGNQLSIGAMNLVGKLGIRGAAPRAPSLVDVTGSFAQDAAGTLDLDGGELNVAGSLILDGTVTGTGIIRGSATAGGTVGPGIPLGSLRFEGRLTVSPASLFNLELGGTAPGSFDQVVVAATPLLDGRLTFTGGSAGTLGITLINGFVPSFGDQFDVFLFASVLGEFSAYTGLNLGGGLSLVPQYFSDRLTLTVVPAPASVLVATPLLLALRRRRARG